MKPISILVIDDQFAREDFLRTDLLVKTGIVEAGTEQSTHGNIKATFCSGQVEQRGVIRNDYEVIAKAVAQGWGRGADFGWNLVLLDVRFDSQPIQSGDDTFGLNVREQLREDFPDLPVVMFSSKHESEIINSQEHYLSKDGISERELKRVLLDHGKLEMDQARLLLGISDDIVFASREMLKVYRDAYVHAENDQPILILGESGSGKESLARYIHRASSRGKGPFVAENMVSLPETLVESELFGYEKGAFTGATKSKKGRFEEADRGTLFLDEIGEMALLAQAKILRAVQEKTIRRVGGERDITVDVRFISATHCNLGERIVAREFRGDLFYRISGVTISIPPLRDRRADIIPLADYFLAREMSARSKRGIHFSGSAMRKLEQYNFPGNVRDLENLIIRLVGGTGNNRVISADEIDFPASDSNDEQHVTREKVHLNTDNSDTSLSSLPASISLANLHELIASIEIKADDPALQGIKPRMEEAMHVLMQRCAGAALERCKKPMDGDYVLQTALQLLADDKTVKGAALYRELDKIFGRPQKTASVNQDDLKALVEIWKRQGR